MADINYLNRNAFLVIELLSHNSYYLRELAKKLDLVPSLVHKIISKLVSQKIVVVEKEKNRKYLRLNYGFPLTENILSLILVNNILNASAFKKIKKMKPIGMYLFGSAASGKIAEDSDIDLAFYFDFKPDSLKLSSLKRELSNELGRDIHLIIITNKKLEEMRKENIELLNQIKNKSIVLDGEMFE